MSQDDLIQEYRETCPICGSLPCICQSWEEFSSKGRSLRDWEDAEEYDRFVATQRRE